MAESNGTGTSRSRTKREEDIGSIVLQAINQYEATGGGKTSKTLIRILIGALILCVATIVVTTVFYVNTINQMHETYIRETEEIIVTRTEIELTNQWERLPVNQRKERVREQFYQIVRYYNNNVPDEQKMADEQILDTFNQLWICTERLPHVNFFLPIAYMKTMTNFNPVYNLDYKRGIAGFYLRSAEAISNLPIVRDDPVFRVDYRGAQTLNNPVEAVKLLVARLDDLMITFNNREDWVLLALFTDEYQVISEYWDEGNGAIPDEYYESGQLAEALRYYHAFKNWQIPMTESISSNE